MTIERHRPLPAGRYWLDVFPPNAGQWDLWTSSMRRMDPPHVNVEVTEHFSGVDGAADHDFVIFSTDFDNVAYQAAGLPSPTIAGPEIQTSDDTVSKPPPPLSIADQLQQAASSLGTGAKVGMGLGVAIVVTIAGVALLKKR
jgi:hypothetical protein